MRDLIAFLRTNLEKDEEVARAAAVRPLRARGRYGPLSDSLPEQTTVDAIGVVWYRHDTGWSGIDSGTFPAGQAHFEHFSPARELADIAAKKVVVDLAEELMVERARARGALVDANHAALIGAREVLATVLRLFAQPYSGLPDFDPEWMPKDERQVDPPECGCTECLTGQYRAAVDWWDYYAAHPEEEDPRRG